MFFILTTTHPLIMTTKGGGKGFIIHTNRRKDGDRMNPQYHCNEPKCKLHYMTCSKCENPFRKTNVACQANHLFNTLNCSKGIWYCTICAIKEGEEKEMYSDEKRPPITVV